MNEPVWIAGVGMTPFGIFPELSVEQLAHRAVAEALKDANASVADIGAAVFGNATQGILEGQNSIRGQIVFRSMGLHSIPVLNVENACATGSSALHTAISYVRSGVTDVALAAGAEKMNVGNKELTNSVFDGGFDVRYPDALNEALARLGGEEDNSAVGRRSIFMDIYAAMARSYMRDFGATPAAFAAVASKNHMHSISNERAHFRKPMTPDDILNARALSYPLTVPMCAPITDGAAAAIVCNSAGLQRLGSQFPVLVLACAIGTGVEATGPTKKHITERLGAIVYEQAGIGPEDISVAEVHDATAVGEIIQTEMLGLVPRGGGGKAAIEGHTSIGGRIPVNPSGGLESKGHPLGATGIGQIFELVEQLRGTAGARQIQGARFALAENGGGFHRDEEAVAVITILGNQGLLPWQ